MFRKLTAVVILLAGCTAAPVDGVMGDPPRTMASAAPEGGWPELGTVTGTWGDAVVAWTTYDHSVGAYDASAWFADHDGPVVLTLIGYPPGQSEARDGLIRVEATLAGPIAAGVGFSSVTVALVDGRDWDAPVAVDPAAAMVLDSVTRERPAGESGYGQVTGTVTGDLCPANGGDCRAFALRFDTELQFDGV